MNSLLEVVPFPAKRRTALPLLLEFAVSPATAPYLVSSTKATMWIERPLRKLPGPTPREIVRAALRKVDPPTYLQEVVDAVVGRGRQAEWGNVHPLTPEGIKAAVDHIRYYEIDSVDILASLDAVRDESLFESIEADVTEAEWLRPGQVIVVPSDRAYIGFLTVRGASLVSVVHNASRGMAIAMRDPEK